MPKGLLIFLLFVFLLALTMMRVPHLLQYTLFLSAILCTILQTCRGQIATANPASEDGVASSILDGEVELDIPENVVLEAEPEPIVEVEDYLEQLSVEELEKICTERGFDVIPRKDGQPLQRSDYLEAARRCLSLEDEMNAILAQNPELAAELEAEILRMQQHKERLEQEREELLAQKQLLEKQLEQAGIDLLEARESTKAASIPLSEKAPEDMTFQEVIRYTFTELYKRVAADVRFVYKVCEPVLKPTIGALQLGWRHGKPHLIAAWKEVSKRSKQIYAIAKGRIEEKLQANVAGKLQ